MTDNTFTDSDGFTVSSSSETAEQIQAALTPSGEATPPEAPKAEEEAAPVEPEPKATA